MTAPFQILEHPADIGFRAFGNSLPQLFENAALALISIAGETDNVQPGTRYPLEATAHDPESLLVAWLSEVLYWLDGKRIGFRSVHVEEIDPGRIAGFAMGEPWDSKRHRAKIIVKAVTWHQLRIHEENGRWSAEVYLDI